MINAGFVVEIPQTILSNPALLFLYHRVEQILGIRAESGALIKLNEYLEKSCGASFIENPAEFERMLSSREQIFTLSKFLTVNETYFFREGVHFDALARLLPQMIKTKRSLQVCSAATSIGCEAYSIAMLLDYHANNGLDFDFTVDAFDINADAIEAAKNARYTSNALRTDGSKWKDIFDLYLIPDGSEYIIKESIRKKVRFFPHNIMRGIEKRYDIIFFRNALIYFSSGSRILVLSALAESLFRDGLLFVGISETSSVQHPSLADRCLTDIFYYQKIADMASSGQLEYRKNDIPSPPHPAKKAHNAHVSKPVQAPKPVPITHEEPQIEGRAIAAILETEGGMSHAQATLDKIAAGTADSLSVSELAASVVYFLGIQDFSSADISLSYLEKFNDFSPIRFLRGEYYFLQGSADEAKGFYEEAAQKNKDFWPAFYRIAALAAEGNQTRYEYKIKKAIESIELLQKNESGSPRQYECFLGGFSPDYFRRILEKKLRSK